MIVSFLGRHRAKKFLRNFEVNGSKFYNFHHYNLPSAMFFLFGRAVHSPDCDVECVCVKSEVSFAFSCAPQPQY